MITTLTILEIAKKVQQDYKAVYKDYLRNYSFYFKLIEEFGLEKGNMFFVIIVFCYDKKSEYLNVTMERKDAKLKVLRLLDINIDDDFIAFTENKNEKCNNAIDAFLSLVKEDWRFKQAQIYYDYHSSTQIFSKNTLKDPKQLVDMGKAMLLGEEVRRKGDEIIIELEKEFSEINAILKKEGKPKLTEYKESWEQHVFQNEL